MANAFQYVVWLLYISLSSCTDLAAVYGDNVLILRDADLIPRNSTLSWESLCLDLPWPLSYPVGLAQDVESNRLFVAEAKPKEDAIILSISLSPQFKVVNMTPAVKSKTGSVIEGMSYSPQSKHLYWTDASSHYIYKASVPSEHNNDIPYPQLIEDLGRRNSPRGLALDPCNELLYWSERSASGNVPSSVEMWDPDGNKHHVVEQDEGKENFYQGLAFDESSGKLVWAVTHGQNSDDSSCRIISTSVDEMHHEELVNLENCYPFSLAVDEKYAYWADWSREGIMRASRSDPNDVVRLLHTPLNITSKYKYIGAYGLVKISVENVGVTSCQMKKEIVQDDEEKMVEDSAVLLKSKTVEERGKGTAKASDANGDSLDHLDGQYVHSEETKHITAEHADSEGKSEHIKEYDDGQEVSPAPTEHSSIEEKEMYKDNEIYEDDIVDTYRYMLTGSQANSPSVESRQKAKKPKSVDTVTRVYNDETQAGIFTSQSSYEVPTTECNFRYNEDHLVMVIVILAVIVVMFFCSTIILAVLLYRRRMLPCIPSKAASGAPQAVIARAPRQVKRFGPKKSFDTGNKSGLSGLSTCSGLANDSVSINIEDCCQMTLCETPCYTTVKKQGKSYKDVRKNHKTSQDNQGLLDDSEEI